MTRLPAALLTLYLALTSRPGQAADHPAPPAGTSRALIVVSLPGDAAHDEQFLKVGRQYRDWVQQSLGCKSQDVQFLIGRKTKDRKDPSTATGENIALAITELKQKLRPADRLWVFFVGQGSHDGEQAIFHLPGQDLRGPDLGKLFRDVRCREQVFWMTGACSGWFLKPLSAPGRIVITATEPEADFDETEFPQALARVLQRPRDRLDTNRDGKVSILELFEQTTAEVKARFAADQRAPTERAHLDDNGDGKGTAAVVRAGGAGQPTSDGTLAERTHLPAGPPSP